MLIITICIKLMPFQTIFGLFERTLSFQDNTFSFYVDGSTQFFSHSYLLSCIWDLRRLIFFTFFVILCNFCDHRFLPNGRIEVFNHVSVWCGNIFVIKRCIFLKILQLKKRKVIISQTNSSVLTFQTPVFV